MVCMSLHTIMGSTTNLFFNDLSTTNGKIKKDTRNICGCPQKRLEDPIFRQALGPSLCWGLLKLTNLVVFYGWHVVEMATFGFTKSNTAIFHQWNRPLTWQQWSIELHGVLNWRVPTTQPESTGWLKWDSHPHHESVLTCERNEEKRKQWEEKSQDQNGDASAVAWSGGNGMKTWWVYVIVKHAYPAAFGNPHGGMTTISQYGV